MEKPISPLRKGAKQKDPDSAKPRPKIVFGEYVICPSCRARTKSCIKCNGWGIVENKGAITWK